MQDAVIATLAVPGDAARHALLLARSVRDFGGALADAPIAALVPDGGPRMSRPVATAFEDLGVRLVPFSVPQDLAGVPFAVKAAAAAHIEASTDADLLVWLDPDTLILRDAREFLIPEHAALGWRPVHHRNIGLADGDPVEGLWAEVLGHCGVPPESLFPATTNVGERIEVYVNAGVWVVRPERGLGEAWLHTLAETARDPAVVAITRRDEAASLFLHQVVWTAVLLARLTRTEMIELTAAVNYPLHLHHEIPAGRRALSLRSLTAVRTEGLLDDPEWRERVPILAPLAPWLEGGAA
ncbi:MAG: hypothetical protein KQH83_09040 [Actinobacteria bacterium]|nr:hypothetical protein [Actinomycetota bacterium]